MAQLDFYSTLRAHASHGGTELKAKRLGFEFELGRQLNTISLWRLCLAAPGGNVDGVAARLLRDGVPFVTRSHYSLYVQIPWTSLGLCFGRLQGRQIEDKDNDSVHLRRTPDMFSPIQGRRGIVQRAECRSTVKSRRHMVRYIE